MSTDTTGTPAGGPPAGLPPRFAPLAAELETFHRLLPQLLADGEAGRYVVIKGGQTFGVWDTFPDATQYGHERFPDGRFMAQEIDPRLQPVLDGYFGPAAAREAG